MASPASRSVADAPASPRERPITLAAAVDELEREMIEATMHRSAGNVSEAARILGLTRRGLYLKLRRLGLEAHAGMDTK